MTRIPGLWLNSVTSMAVIAFPRFTAAPPSSPIMKLLKSNTATVGRSSCCSWAHAAPGPKPAVTAAMTAVKTMAGFRIP